MYSFGSFLSSILSLSLSHTHTHSLSLSLSQLHRKMHAFISNEYDERGKKRTKASERNDDDDDEEAGGRRPCPVLTPPPPPPPPPPLFVPYIHGWKCCRLSNCKSDIFARGSVLLHCICMYYVCMYVCMYACMYVCENAAPCGNDHGKRVNRLGQGERSL